MSKKQRPSGPAEIPNTRQPAEIDPVDPSEIEDDPLDEPEISPLETPDIEPEEEPEIDVSFTGADRAETENEPESCLYNRQCHVYVN